MFRLLCRFICGITGVPATGFSFDGSTAGASPAATGTMHAAALPDTAVIGKVPAAVIAILATVAVAAVIAIICIVIAVRDNREAENALKIARSNAEAAAAFAAITANAADNDLDGTSSGEVYSDEASSDDTAPADSE